MVQYFPIVTGSLTVTGSVNVSGSITTNSTITATTLVVQTITSSISAITGSTNFGSLSTNTHTFTGSMYVTGALYVPTGSVGIGTISPWGKFNVVAGSNLSFVVQDSGVADTIELTNYSSGGGIRGIQLNGSIVTFGTGTAGGGSTPERIRITSAGNVGIGTNNPSYLLDVSGEIRTTSNLRMTGTSSQLLQTTANSVAGDNVMVLYNSNANSYGLYIGAGSGTNHALYCTDSTRTANLFKVQGNGNVGIGTGSPSYKLDIMGNTSSAGDVTILRLWNNTGENCGSINFDNTFGPLAQITGTKMGGGSSADDGTLIFSTAQNSVLGERIRIASSGKITYHESAYFVCGTTGYRFNNSTDAFNNFVALDNGNATLRGTLTQNSSDERLKNNIQIIPNALNKINSLRGVTFEWNQEIYETSRTTDIGVIAQDVQAVLPDAVTLAPFDTNFETNTSKSGENYLTVYYEKLIPLLIEGIKELTSRVQELENK